MRREYIPPSCLVLDGAPGAAGEGYLEVWDRPPFRWYPLEESLPCEWSTATSEYARGGEQSKAVCLRDSSAALTAFTAILGTEAPSLPHCLASFGRRVLAGGWAERC